MKQTSAQIIAEYEAKIARVKAKDRSLENGQKIISGAVVIHAARQNPKIRKWFVEELDKTVTRKADRTRIEPLLVELRAMPASDA